MATERLHYVRAVGQVSEQELSSVARERDFLLGLLRLHEHGDAPQPFVQEALELLVDALGARHGYLELRDDEVSDGITWHAAKGYSENEVKGVRQSFSRGIIAEALAHGRQVHTASAQDDPRFADLESVRTRGIQAVLCAPIRGSRPLGVVYVEGAPDRGPFDQRAEWLLAMFTRGLGPIGEHVLANERERSENLSRILPYPGVIARSPSMRPVLSKLALAAPLDVAVLLTGPSGTGKSLLARAVHANSRRAQKPFVEVNCAALPEPLFENEVFGSGPGGHSNAPRGGSQGRVGAAEAGTLFLDDVGELSLGSQAKLLQLLQSRTYFRLGESIPRQADIRVIAATNVDLEERVQQKMFREDLFYRLRVLVVHVPSLGRRREDVLPMAKHFLGDACDRHDFGSLHLSPAAASAVEVSDWPGNVRQLAHAIEAAAVNAAMMHSSHVDTGHLFPPRAGETAANESESQTLQSQLHAVRARIVRGALEGSDWNVSEAARRLDVARSYLYKLIEAYGIERTGD